MATLRIHSEQRRLRDCYPFLNLSFVSLYFHSVLVRDLTMAHLEWIALFLFLLHTAHQYQTNVLKSFLLVSFFSKSSLTPHCQQVRYIFHSFCQTHIKSCFSLRPSEVTKSHGSFFKFILPSIHYTSHPSFNKLSLFFFLSTCYKPGIQLDSEETKINVIFSLLAGLTI